MLNRFDHRFDHRVVRRSGDHSEPVSGRRACDGASRRTGAALLPVALAALAALAGTGCAADRSHSGLFAPYRIAIPQGNYVDEQSADMVRPGMSRDMVRNILGSPLITDPFHPDQWGYVFRLIHPSGETLRRRVIVVFDGERVREVQKLDPLPERNDRQDPALPGFEPSRRQRQVEQDPETT